MGYNYWEVKGLKINGRQVYTCDEGGIWIIDDYGFIVPAWEV